MYFVDVELHWLQAFGASGVSRAMPSSFVKQTVEAVPWRTPHFTYNYPSAAGCTEPPHILICWLLMFDAASTASHRGDLALRL